MPMIKIPMNSERTPHKQIPAHTFHGFNKIHVIQSGLWLSNIVTWFVRASNEMIALIDCFVFCFFKSRLLVCKSAPYNSFMIMLSSLTYHVIRGSIQWTLSWLLHILLHMSPMHGAFLSAACIMTLIFKEETSPNCPATWLWKRPMNVLQYCNFIISVSPLQHTRHHSAAL